MSQEERLLLNLFDSYWFEYEVFSAKKPHLSMALEESTPIPPQPVHVIGDIGLFEKVPIMRKSFSEQFLCTNDCSDSPSSDLSFTPKLQTVVSGTEVESFQESNLIKDFLGFDILNEINSNTNRSSGFLSHTDEIITSRGRSMDGRRKKKKNYRNGISVKSLSELEFEELKGFMDLGFVFSDEDKDSRLVSIIPGLQRFGKNGEELSDQSFRELQQVSVPRPYLSEAWGDLEARKRYRNPFMDSRIPDFGNEMELKDHLRFWAHTVASTV